jgi:phytoene synthase
MTAHHPAEPDDSALQAQVSGSSFYAAMRIMPKAERAAMFAIYRFCRMVDDIADDGTRTRPQRAAELNGWRSDLEALYDGKPAGRAAFLAQTVHAFGLRRADFMTVIDGMDMDVAEDIRAPDAATLDLYCDRVACAVGRLSTRVFGMEERPGLELAQELGRALQLTNILRDLDEDAAIGRLYLPGDGA